MIQPHYQLAEYSQLTNVALSPSFAQEIAANYVGRLDISASLDKPGSYILQSYQYVGQIVGVETQITIIPKVPIRALTEMLGVVYELIQWQPQLAEYDSLPGYAEMIIKLFLSEVATLLSQGVDYGYESVTEDSTFIRGQIDFTSQLTEHFAQPLQHRCNFEVLSANTIENQLIKQALILSQPLISAPTELSLARQLLLLLEHVNLPDNPANSLAQLEFTRLQGHYRTILLLVRWLLESLAPIIATSSSYTPTLLPALLVDMNRLFERYLTYQLQQRCYQYSGSNHYHLSYQTQVYLDIAQKMALYPDLIGYQGDCPVVIIDAKYKVTKDMADYYQMIAYCLATGVTRAFLVYPAGEIPTSEIRIKQSNIVISSVALELSSSSSQLQASLDQLWRLIFPGSSPDN